MTLAFPDKGRAADVISEFNVAGWFGASYEEDSEFTYCLIGRKGRDGRYVLILRAVSIGYALGIYDPAGPFSESSVYATTASVDRRWALDAEGIGGSPTLLRIPLPSHEVDDALKHIAAGNRLRIGLPGSNELSVTLKGSRKAIGRLNTCYEQHAPTHEVPMQSAQEQPPKDVNVQVSGRIRQLAKAVDLSPPSGSLAVLRRNAITFDNAAMISLGLALIELPDQFLYNDEAAAWVSLAADAGDVRGTYVLGRMMQMQVTSETFEGHALELISEAADMGLAQALVDRAHVRRVTDLPAALADLKRAADQGHAQAADLLIVWQPVVKPDSKPKPQEEPAPQQTSPKPEQAIEPLQPSLALPQSAPVIAPVIATVTSGQPVKVRFSDLPASGTHWLAIAASDHSAEQYYDFAMLDPGTTEGTHLFKVLPVGQYEIRLYLNWPEGGYQIATSAPVTVGTIPDVQPEPAPAMPTYSDLGSRACFGGASYPDIWKSQADCGNYGCNFGQRDVQSCLSMAAEKGASLVIHGVSDGLRANECWLQNGCADLREHPDFAAFGPVDESFEPAPDTLAADTSIQPAPEPDVTHAPETAPVVETVPEVDTAQIGVTTTAPENPDAHLVLAVQLLLMAAGYDTGAPSGMLTPQTVAAIRSFQGDRGLFVDGRATPAIREAILAAMSEQPASTEDVSGGDLGTDDPVADTSDANIIVSEPTQDTTAEVPENTATATPDPVGEPAGFIGPLCEDYNHNYTLDITEIPGFSCYLTPPQTIHIGPEDDRLVTCGLVSIQDKESNRTLKQCRAEMGSTFTFPIKDGQAECYDANFYADGTLESCEHQYTKPLLNIETMGQTFVCAKALFDEQERLTSCQGDGDGGGDVELPTGYNVPVTCTTNDYRIVRLAEGRVTECWLATAFEPETDDLLISCAPDQPFRFTEGLLVEEVDLRNCDKKLKIAIGPATDTLMRPHPEPGPTDLKAMPMCNTSSDQCGLKEPRWIAMGPDGAEQLLCKGRVHLHGNPGYLKECKTEKLPVLRTLAGPVKCNEFEFGPDGYVTYCRGSTQIELSSYKILVRGVEVACALDDHQKKLRFFPGGKLQSCTLENNTNVPTGKNDLTVPCTGGTVIDFWPSGGVRKCTTSEPANVAGPFGGTTTCTSGAIQFLSDGTLHKCRMQEGETLPATLPDGQQVSCLNEFEMHVSTDKETGAMTSTAFGTCNSFANEVQLMSANTTYQCVGAAFQPPADGGGLIACVTLATDQFEVNHDGKPKCGRTDALTLVFDEKTGALKTVHQCKE